MLTTARRRVLLAAAAWTTYLWGSRLYLMWTGDESTGFKAVHTVLAAISLAFAAAIARIAFSRNSTVSDDERSRENEAAG